MIRTFRLRLTLWYLACFALLFSVLTAALYGVLSRALIGRPKVVFADFFRAVEVPLSVSQVALVGCLENRELLVQGQTR